MFHIISEVDENNEVWVLDPNDGVLERVSIQLIKELKKSGLRFKTNIYLNFLVGLHTQLCKKQLFNDNNIYLDIMKALQKYSYGNTKFKFPDTNIMFLDLAYEVQDDFFIVQIKDISDFKLYFYAITPFGISHLFRTSCKSVRRNCPIPKLVSIDDGYIIKYDDFNTLGNYTEYKYNKNLKLLSTTKVDTTTKVRRLINGKIVVFRGNS